MEALNRPKPSSAFARKDSREPSRTFQFATSRHWVVGRIRPDSANSPDEVHRTQTGVNLSEGERLVAAELVVERSQALVD
ncbi:MAG: hypothetical protein A2664_00325 [Candidatus Taylorbacteria bacterium RIFCSPHIGHO2_01_FULL_46_22b]|uniref:Uncharacterized protein n=1 Tax=Candidatus Taylorbacteria bacterium RIFCSPHIGHO2_01_FULL_46_22b TaxID=1802301 RepID=A0A1G2M432_9BACT|nr:MAG: hypothetical protein A2664_00325 [Candidatus Taylorbacteria bacterium RIFCSPHIGHO2_01_FULL_46_22b]